MTTRLDSFLNSNGKWKRYPEYKDSGIEWLGEVPVGWEIKRLKHIAKVNLSNVDKKTKDGEEPVKLCNYVDVYNNDYITSDFSFMEATASTNQISKFSLMKGDVIITKDSESWDDIAVPAYVPADINGVICGYHLAYIKPFSEINGEYLFRSFSSPQINYQFRVEANGITRYGIGKYDVDNSIFPIPPHSEQKAIVTFLDRETSKIDSLIEKKERLIELLEEKRTALISHAVTKGLDPDAPMKDSRIEWLGKIPEGWEVKKLKYVTKKINDGTHFTPNYIDDGIPFLRVTDIQSDLIDLENVNYISKNEHNELIKRCNPEKGDLLLSKNGTIGITKVVDWDFPFSIFVSICLIKFKKKIIDPNFFSYFFNSNVVNEQIYRSSKKTSVTNLHIDKIRELFTIVPPLETQVLIIKHLDKKSHNLDSLISNIKTQIGHLKEYRTSLITSAVTGKIDVREEVAT